MVTKSNQRVINDNQKTPKMSHLSPPLSPHSISQEATPLANYSSTGLDLNVENSKNWLKQASSLKQAMATASNCRPQTQGKHLNREDQGSRNKDRLN